MIHKLIHSIGCVWNSTWNDWTCFVGIYEEKVKMLRYIPYTGNMFSILCILRRCEFSYFQKRG